MFCSRINKFFSLYFEICINDNSIIALCLIAFVVNVQIMITFINVKTYCLQQTLSSVCSIPVRNNILAMARDPHRLRKMILWWEWICLKREEKKDKNMSVFEVIEVCVWRVSPQMQYSTILVMYCNIYNQCLSPMTCISDANSHQVVLSINL